MPDLPTEIWTIVAKHLRRKPPVGESGNWNDHFHQQDLVNLMRVDKSLYKVASDVLYHSPIVQNMGLFLVGVDQAYPRVSLDRKRRADFAHKQTLLAGVKNLHMVHHSSNKPLRNIYMQTTRSSTESELLKMIEGDELGQMDLQGWMLAERLAGSTTVGPRQRYTFRYRNFLTKMQTMTFGRWDDGRWKIYNSNRGDGWIFSNENYWATTGTSNSENRITTGLGQHAPDMGITRVVRNVCPSTSVQTIIQDIFVGFKPLVATCYDARAVISLAESPALKIVHEARFKDVVRSGLIPTRMYITTKQLPRRTSRFVGAGPEVDLGVDKLTYDIRMRPTFKPSDTIRPLHHPFDRDLYESDSDSDEPEIAQWPFDMEICLVPEVDGNAAQLWMAREIQDALANYETACF